MLLDSRFICFGSTVDTPWMRSSVVIPATSTGVEPWVMGKISEDADKMLDLYLDRVETEIPF